MAVMIFWDNIFGSGPLKGLTNFQLFELAAP
jgi:hypothetical protein